MQGESKDTVVPAAMAAWAHYQSRKTFTAFQERCSSTDCDG